MSQTLRKSSLPQYGPIRRRSAIEAVTNVFVGYLVAVTANYFVLPAFGYMVTVQDSFTIGLAFTAISMMRIMFYVGCSIGLINRLMFCCKITR